MRIDSVPVVDKRYMGRPLSNLVKWMMKEGDVDRKTVARYMGCSIASFDNKLKRDTFTPYDIAVISEICGCVIEIISPNDESTIYHM